MGRRMCIIKSLISEKSTLANKKNCFCFIADETANKKAISKDIERKFGVKVRKVNLCRYLTKAQKRYSLTGVSERKIHGYKKVYVFVKNGERLDFNKFI